MEKEDRNIKEYELGVLVKNETDLPAIASLVRGHQGEVTTDFRAKRVALSYPIKKEKEAIFAYATFRAHGEAAKELEHDLNLRGDVLRSLITIPPKIDLKKQSSREMPEKRVSVFRPVPVSSPEPRRESTSPLSNEALTKKIEEILK
jgi:ribosomal protein S6